MTLVNVRPSARRKPDLFNGFDGFFDDFFRTDLQPAYRPANGRVYRPAVNVVETADELRLELVAPGLEKNDFQVSIEEGVLTIEAKRERPATEGEVIHRNEFGNYAFQRRFELSQTIDTGNVKAAYINGILSLTLPKKEEAKPKPPRIVEVA